MAAKERKQKMNAKNQKERQEDLLAWFEEEETIRAAEPTQIVTALAALEKACLVQGLLFLGSVNCCRYWR